MARVVTTILLFLLLLNNPASACLWVRGTSNEGFVVEREGSNAAEGLERSLKVSTRKRGEELLVKHRNGRSLDDRNNYAVGLVYLGRSEEAIQALNELEKERPGDYATAANLGTAYELAGKNTEALKWIREGLRRNPDSHRGSEWVHVAILEAKLANQKDPTYLQKHGVINLEPFLSGKPVDFLTPEGKVKSVEEVRDDMVYQLEERLQFVRSKEPIVAHLLFELGHLQEASVTLEVANRIYRMAEDFGYPAAKIQPLIARNQTIIRRANPFAWLGQMFLFLLCLGVLAVGVLFLRKIWRRFVRKPGVVEPKC